MDTKPAKKASKPATDQTRSVGEKSPAAITADWERIEIDYRAGVKTLRQIADENGITHGAVNKRAKAKGWTRDLTAKIRAKADDKVSKAAVSTQVSTERAATEQAVVEANAELHYQIRMAHRLDIKRGREIFGALLAEVEHQTGNLDLFEKLGDLLDRTEEGGEDTKPYLDKLNELYRKIISTPGRVESAKKLTEMLEKLVRLERQAFNLDDEKPPEADGLTKLLHSIASSNTSSLRPVAADPEHDEG